MVELKVFRRAAASAVIIAPLAFLLLCEEANAEHRMFTAHVDDAAVAGADQRVPLGDLPGATLKFGPTDDAEELGSFLPRMEEAGPGAEVRIPLFGLGSTLVEHLSTDRTGRETAPHPGFPTAFSGAGNGTAFLDLTQWPGVLSATDGADEKSPFLHTLDDSTQQDVVKPNLIDLEAQAWATGRKQAQAVQRERLSDWALGNPVMRKSGLPHNAELKGEREDEEPPRHENRGHQSNRRKYYSGYETLDISPSDVFSAAEYPWKQAAVVVTASGLETEIQNSGKEAVINLLEKRISNAMKTMSNNISTGIYSDGTGTSGKQITGLEAQVATVVTSGTVGGIDRSVTTNTFWRNQTLQDSTFSSATVLAKMEALWITCVRGTDKPDLITTDDGGYAAYWAALQAFQRIASDTKGKLGFEELAFLSARVIYDGDSGHRDNTMYFLNTDYIYFRPHSDRNFVPLPKRESVNQDAIVVPIVFAGNLTASNLARQGVLWKA